MTVFKGPVCLVMDSYSECETEGNRKIMIHVMKGAIKANGFLSANFLPYKDFCVYILM